MTEPRGCGLHAPLLDLTCDPCLVTFYREERDEARATARTLFRLFRPELDEARWLTHAPWLAPEEEGERPMKSHPTQAKDRLRDAAERHTFLRHGPQGTPPELEASRIALWAAALDFAVWYEAWKDQIPDTAALIEAQRLTPGTR